MWKEETSQIVLSQKIDAQSSKFTPFNFVIFTLERLTTQFSHFLNKTSRIFTFCDIGF